MIKSFQLFGDLFFKLPQLLDAEVYSDAGLDVYFGLNDFIAPDFGTFERHERMIKTKTDIILFSLEGVDNQG